MKKLFLITIIFSNFIVSTSYGNWLDNIFSKTVSTDQLVVRKNLSYTINSQKPYSGNIEDTHENGQVSLKGKYEDGLKTGLFIKYYDNGQIKKSSTFFMGTEEGKVEEFHKNGNIKTSYKMIDGKINGLFKVFDEDGYLKIEQLEFYKNNQSLIQYESHKLIIKEQGKEFREGKWYDKNNLRIMTIIDEKTQKLFSGEYVYINKKKYPLVFFYKFKNGKLNGKGYYFFFIVTPTTNKKEFKDGMLHGLFESIETNTDGKILYKHTGKFKLNKPDGIWVELVDGKRTQTTWNNGIQQK